jgi:hypothetical protein
VVVAQRLCQMPQAMLILERQLMQQNFLVVAAAVKKINLFTVALMTL